MKIKFLFGFIIILFLSTCSNEAAGPPSDIPDIEFPIYYGTYLYNDAECGGADIQYATLDEDEITFFDYLGDECDDTVGCYTTNTYELTELSQDTFLIVSEVGSSITNGEISLDGDSSITLTYEGNNGMVEHSWEKKRIFFKTDFRPPRMPRATPGPPGWSGDTLVVLISNN